MKKSNFVKIINALLDQVEKDRQIEQLFRSILDGHFIYTGTNTLCDAIADLITAEMDDTENRAEWWLYESSESSERKIRIDGVESVLDTPEKLYDFIKWENK